MRLLKADFTRFFLVGFLLGAALVYGTMGEDNHNVVPTAIAATE